MPSYRVTLVIGVLAPGVSPAAVLPAARDAAADLTTVEAFDIHVVAGHQHTRQARLVVRFAADEYEVADQIAQHVATVVTQLAEVTSWKLTQRMGSRWS
ncbi:MAG: hypothetical protein ACOH1T_06050 [Microbacteriaceae bacterium]